MIPLPPRAATLRLAGLAAGSLACFGLGWLGYRLVQPSQGPAFPSQVLQPSAVPAPSVPEPPLLPAAADRGSLSSGATPSEQLSPLELRHGALTGLAPLPASGAGLSCLAGGSPEIASPADPSNYGDRQPINWLGERVRHTPQLIVLHETVVDEKTALSLFQQHRSDDDQQASYHVLIGRDGRRIRVVDDDKRAFGAGDSTFQGNSVQLRQAIPASVNNFALHVSLVSPPDGADGEAHAHSGYTQAQYRSLARQIALWQSRYGIPTSQVTTHQEVDRSGTRHDPRSVDWNALGNNLRSLLLACATSAPLARSPGAPSSPAQP